MLPWTVRLRASTASWPRCRIEDTGQTLVAKRASPDTCIFSPEALALSAQRQASATICHALYGAQLASPTRAEACWGRSEPVPGRSTVRKQSGTGTFQHAGEFGDCWARGLAHSGGTTKVRPAKPSIGAFLSLALARSMRSNGWCRAYPCIRAGQRLKQTLPRLS